MKLRLPTVALQITVLKPWARTGHNQPSGNRFIFGLAKWYWFDSTTETGPLYLDYSAEEIAIAAAYGCESLKQTYQSGDPYTWMGIASKMMPEMRQTYHP